LTKLSYLESGLSTGLYTDSTTTACRVFVGSH